eukprot:CAMPEP_0114320706 /NCGR_PEP_ID=MMETSP0059-20121206/26112_1 /TAXON_ID=36894 /ORGANISM="Pyramimonas parkeae, Strain CCMP726" /LENGTH=169 /DNA_ID=CAMNT_0001448187 /DNA_START=150 /DNA_END=655 /DNA_ORIENTATION=-
MDLPNGYSTDQQKFHMKSGTYGSGGEGGPALAKEHMMLRDHATCKFCLAWTSVEPTVLEKVDRGLVSEETYARTRVRDLKSMAPTPSPCKLAKDELLLELVLKRWTHWEHTSAKDARGVVVHAKYCKAFCPDGHFIFPDGTQRHGKYEGTYEQLLKDLNRLKEKLENQP